MLYAFADDYSLRTVIMGAQDTPDVDPDEQDWQDWIAEVLGDEPVETITERDFDTEQDEALAADEAEWIIEQLWNGDAE